MRKGTNHAQEQVQQEGARERRLLVLVFALKDGSIFAAGFAVMIFSTKWRESDIKQYTKYFMSYFM